MLRANTLSNVKCAQPSAGSTLLSLAAYAAALIQHAPRALLRSQRLEAHVCATKRAFVYSWLREPLRGNIIKIFCFMIERRWNRPQNHLFSMLNLNYGKMCLYPRIIMNPKYKPNKKNGGHPEKAKDKRLLGVPIGCGNCIECRKQLANEWKIRLSEELKKNNGYFVTLTFSESSLIKLEQIVAQETGEVDDNKIAKKAVRYFLERWRKKYTNSLRHWLITELGHDNTERLHLHGIMFTEEEKIQELEKIWKYGWVHIGSFCNKKTINYIIKYVTKIDNDHKNFKGKILCSPGIGKYYISKGKKFNLYEKGNTKEYYRSSEGYKLNLPIYYRNHIYSEEEREKLWLEKLDKKEIYVLGVKYKLNTSKDINNYLNALKKAQEKNIELGYSGINWKSSTYMKDLTKLNKKLSGI